MKTSEAYDEFGNNEGESNYNDKKSSNGQDLDHLNVI